MYFQNNRSQATSILGLILLNCVRDICSHLVLECKRSTTYGLPDGSTALESSILHRNTHARENRPNETRLSRPAVAVAPSSIAGKETEVVENLNPQHSYSACRVHSPRYRPNKCPIARAEELLTAFHSVGCADLCQSDLLIHKR